MIDFGANHDSEDYPIPGIVGRRIRAGLVGLAFLYGLAGCDISSAQENSAAEPPGVDDPAAGLAITIGPAPRVEPAEVGGPGIGDAPGGHNRIESAIGGFDCSRLRLVQPPGSSTVELRGHVPSAELASDLVAASQRLAGNDVRVTGNLMVLPPPICGVLETVEEMGLPQSNDQQNDPLAVGRQAWAEIPRAIDGDTALFSLRAPACDAYLYIDYYDSDGMVTHLTPSRFRFGADAMLEIGGADSTTQFIFAPPLGLDIAVVIATTEPLYRGIRPLMENGRSYLAWLQGRVLALREERPDIRAEWAFMLIRVEPG